MTSLEALLWCKEHFATVMWQRDGKVEVIVWRPNGSVVSMTRDSFLDAVIWAKKAHGEDA